MIIRLCRFRLGITRDRYRTWRRYTFPRRCTRRSTRSTTIRVVRTVRWVGGILKILKEKMFTRWLSFQSPITASPTTLSPTSMPVRHPGARFQYSPGGSPGDGGGSASFSPTHSQQQNTSQVWEGDEENGLRRQMDVTQLACVDQWTRLFQASWLCILKLTREGCRGKKN